MSLALFQSFDNEDYIEEHNIRPIENYILSNLNSNFSPCRCYWERQYNICNKRFIVCQWREKKGIYALLLRKAKQCVKVNCIRIQFTKQKDKSDALSFFYVNAIAITLCKCNSIVFFWCFTFI